MGQKRHFGRSPVCNWRMQERRRSRALDRRRDIHVLHPARCERAEAEKLAGPPRVVTRPRDLAGSLAPLARTARGHS